MSASERGRRGVRRPPFKACRSCHALVPREATRCPYCGSTDLTEEWEGVVVLIDPEKSAVTEYLAEKRPGRYAIIVY